MPVNPKAHPPPTNTITGNMLALKLELRIAYHSNVPKPSTALPGEPCVSLLKHPPAVNHSRTSALSPQVTASCCFGLIWAVGPLPPRRMTQGC